jgi:hyperosmotically inducible protein
MRQRVLLFLLPVILTCAAVAQTTALPRMGGDTDQRIARETMHELLMLPYYSVFDNLAFRVDGNTVTLLGQVVNSSVKSDAEARVKKIEGVDRVVNNIEILPPSPMDDRIRRAEYRAIYGDDALFKYSMGAVPSIHIIVKGGHVTLTGAVDNEADKNVAAIRAKSVPNVFSVDDQIQVANQRAAK